MCVVGKRQATCKVLAVQAAYNIATFGLSAMMLQYERKRYALTPEQLGLVTQCGVNFFILGCWDQNTSRIQILRHSDKKGCNIRI